MLTGSVVNLALANDTGSSQTDFQTSDPRIDGAITNLTWTFANAIVQVDFDGDNQSDHEFATNQTDGSFQFDPSTVVHYRALNAGLNQFTFRTVEFDPASGEVLNGNWSPAFEFYYSEFDLGQMGIEFEGQVLNEGDLIEFGQVTVGTSSSKSISIVNRGPTDLTLSNQVFAPIGFEIENYTPVLLEPGGFTSFDVVFTGTNPGSYSGPVTIFAENANDHSFYFTVGGETKAPEFQLELPNTDSLGNVDFGSVLVSETIQRTISITNVGSDSLNLEGDFTVPTGFNLSAGFGTTTLAPTESTSFTVSFDATTAGVFEGTLLFKRNADTGPFFQVSLLGEKQTPRLAVKSDDSTFDHIMQGTTFGNTLVGTPISRQLTLENQGTLTLSITDIAFPEGVIHDLAETAFDLAPGAQTTFTITFDANEPRQIFDPIIIQSNDPNQAAYQVMVSGVAVSFDQFRMFSDDGNSQTDRISADPRVLGRILAGDQASSVEVLIDTDADQVADLTFAPEETGVFVYDPAPTEPSQITIGAAIKVRNVVTGDDYFTTWQSVTLDYDPDQTNANPTLSPVTLVNDTGSAGDKISYDPAITGSVSNDGYIDGLVVSIDRDGDGSVDGTAITDDQGVFVYRPGDIDVGPQSWVLWVREDVYGGGAIVSDPGTFEFTFVEVDPPTITSVELKYDTGIDDTDHITSIGTLVGTAQADTDSSQFAVEWDIDGDAFADGMVWVEPDGSFEIVPDSLQVGETTIYLRGSDPHRGVTGAWSASITITIESMHTPIVDSIELLEDDGPSDNDNSSTKPDVVGTVDSEYGIENREIQFDHNADGVVDGMTATDSNGEFAYTPSGIRYGQVDLRYRTSIFDQVTQTVIFGEWETFTFEFVGQSLARLDNLRLENDDGNDPNDGITTDPTLLATTMINSDVASFIEVEFDYDDDDSIDATAFSDELGQVRHYANVVTGEESTIRARTRQWDTIVGDYVYSEWSALTFTRLESDYTFSPDVSSSQTLIAQSQDIADIMVSAIADILVAGASTYNGNVNGITGTNNDPGYLLGGLNLGVAVFAPGHGIGGIGIANFGDTAAEDGTLLLDTGFTAPVRGNSSDLIAVNDSQVIAVSIQDANFTITGTYSFTFVVTNGNDSHTTALDSLFEFTYTPTTGPYTITGTLEIDFDAVTSESTGSLITTFTATETVGMTVIWENETASGLDEDSAISFGYSSTFSNGMIHGAVNADASMDYVYSRDFTNTIGVEGTVDFDPVAYAELVATNSEGSIAYDQELSKTVDYDEHGSYQYTTGGTTQIISLFTLIETGSWANHETENGTFEVTEGAAGTIAGSRSILRTEAFSYTKQESGSYQRDNSSATISITSFDIYESGSSSRSGSSSGTFVIADLPGNHHSGTYNRTFSESIEYTYEAHATYVQDSSGTLEITGSFDAGESSIHSKTLTIDGNFDKDLNGINFNGYYHIEYSEDGDAQSGQLGTYLQSNADLSVVGTASQTGNVLASTESDFYVDFASLDSYNGSPIKSGNRDTLTTSTFDMYSEESSEFTFSGGILNGEGTFLVDQETIIHSAEASSLTLNHFEIGNMPSTYDGDGGGGDGWSGFGDGGTNSSPYSYIPVMASGTSHSNSITDSRLTFVDSGGFAYGTTEGFAKAGSFVKSEEHDTIFDTNGDMTFTQSTSDGDLSYDRTWNVVSDSNGNRYLLHVDHGTYVTFGTDVTGDVRLFAGMGGNDVADGPTAEGYLSTTELISGVSNSTTTGTENETGPDGEFASSSFGVTEHSENTSDYSENADYHGNDVSRTREGDYTLVTSGTGNTTSWTSGSFFELLPTDGVIESESDIVSDSGSFSSNSTMSYSMNSSETGQFSESESGKTSHADFTLHQESYSSGDQTSDGTRATLEGRLLPYHTYTDYTDQATIDENGYFDVNLAMEKSTYANFEQTRESTNNSNYQVASWRHTPDVSGQVIDTGITTSTTLFSENGYYTKSPLVDDRQSDFTRDNTETAYTTSIFVGRLSENPRNGFFRSGIAIDWNWEDNQRTVDEEGHISRTDGDYDESGSFESTIDVKSYSSLIMNMGYFVISGDAITTGDLFTKDTMHSIYHQDITGGTYSIDNNEETRSGTKNLTDSKYSTSYSSDVGGTFQVTVRSGVDVIPGTTTDYQFRRQTSIFDKTKDGHSRSYREESGIQFTDSPEVKSASGDFTEHTTGDVATVESTTTWYQEYSDGRGSAIGSQGVGEGAPNGQGGDSGKPYLDIGSADNLTVGFSFSKSFASGTFQNTDYTDDSQNTDTAVEDASTYRSVSFNSAYDSPDYQGTRVVYLEDSAGNPTSNVDFVDEYSGNSTTQSYSHTANTDGTYTIVDGKLDSESYKTRIINHSETKNESDSTYTLVFVGEFNLKPAVPDSEAPFTLEQLPLFGFAPSKLPGFVALLVGPMSDNFFGYFTRMEFETTDYLDHTITKHTDGLRTEVYEEEGTVNTVDGTTTTIDTEFDEKTRIWSMSTSATESTEEFNVDRSVDASEGGGLFGNGTGTVGHLLVSGTKTIDGYSNDTYEKNSKATGTYHFVGPYISPEVLGIISTGDLPDPTYTLTSSGTEVEQTTSHATKTTSFDLATTSTRLSDGGTFTFENGSRTDTETFQATSDQTTEYSFSYTGDGDGRTTGAPPPVTDDNNSGYNSFTSTSTLNTTESYTLETEANGKATATGGPHEYQNEFDDEASKAETVIYTTTTNRHIDAPTGNYYEYGTFTEDVDKTHSLTIHEVGTLGGVAWWTYDNHARQIYTFDHTGSYTQDGDDPSTPDESLDVTKNYHMVGSAFGEPFDYQSQGDEPDNPDSFWDIFRGDVFGFGNWLAREVNDFLVDPEEYFASRKEAMLDALQLGLDVAGVVLDFFFPPLAMAADIINGGISLARGDRIAASLSFAAAIPIVGTGATAAKWTYKAAKISGTIASLGGKATKGFKASVGAASNLGAKSFDLARGAASKAGNLVSSAAKGTKSLFKNSDGTFSLGIRKGCFVADTPVVVYKYGEPQFAFADWEAPEENESSFSLSHLGLTISLGVLSMVIVAQQTGLGRRKRQINRATDLARRGLRVPSPIVRPEVKDGIASCIEFEEEPLSQPPPPAISHFTSPSHWEGRVPTTRDEGRAVEDPEQNSTQNRVRSRRKTRAWMNGALAAAVACLLLSLLAISRNEAPLVDRARLSALPSKNVVGSGANDAGWHKTTAPIQDIQVGQRIPAHNPQMNDREREQGIIEIDPRTWRTFHLEIEKQNGEKLQATLIRPTDWMVERIVETAALVAVVENELAEQQETEQSTVSLVPHTNAQRDCGWSRSLSSIANEVVQFANTSPSDIGLRVLSPFASCLSALEPPTLVSTANPAAFLGRSIQQHVLDAHYESMVLDRELDALAASVEDGDFVDSSIYLDMPEMGAVGLARIVAVEPAPVVSDGPGQIVTGTFRHTAAEVLDLTFERSSGNNPLGGNTVDVSSGLAPHTSGLIELGVTASHPFWVESRQDFVPAGRLQIGEIFHDFNGQSWHLTTITPRAGPHPVFNLEVGVEHVYLVGSDGLLVHNWCLNLRLSSAGRLLQTAPKALLGSRGVHRLVPVLRTAKNNLLHAASRFSLLPNHGYVIFNRRTGLPYKFGISAGRITKDGKSYRALRQLKTFRDADTLVLRHFKNRADALEWEHYTNGFFKDLGHRLKAVLPRGIPFVNW